MKYIPTARALWGGLLALALLATGCKKELDDYYTETGPQFPTLLTTNALGNATKYATGEVVTFELQFAQQTDPIKQVVILQKVEPGRDSTVVQTIPYKAAYSRIKRTDTLVVNYTVPAGDNKALVRVDARVDSNNGQTKTRSFYFRLAEPTPTIVINSGPTNVTLPTATATGAPGDIIRYNVTLNKGGITTAPIPPASITSIPAGILYKDLDSLVTYAKVGSAAERRVVRTKLTASGAELTTNVDIPLPAGSAGQPITFRFEVKVRTPARSASATAAAVYTPAAATPFAAARTGTLTYTGTTGGDLAAYDLTTFAAVPAAGAATSKDLVISSTASNAVQFRTLSTGTRLVRSTTAVYTAATLTNIRQTYNATAAASQVTTLDNIVVGDVIILKLRGLDQYAVVQVTGINRTSATDVTVSFNVKAL
ncbi:hypothetical protein MON38_17705 [Hymenobacter sp. DH14]|uniref:DUF11 domain-containing protein n=1 Tax=Hymenobacter cyanobacteriorum TaxID=2926463 RepID=A0A9X2AJV2_9BACT|nr:hypothetical protein [Hymenobacter cyanobacteriorum]MCI1189264.1 hypothetical protein [Hymenobacter cyanobacteriorum]